MGSCWRPTGNAIHRAQRANSWIDSHDYMNANLGLPLVRPKVVPALDPEFCPAVLSNRAFRSGLGQNGTAIKVALERADGSVSRFETALAGSATGWAQGNFKYLERLLKFFLWSRGGCKIYFAGP